MPIVAKTKRMPHDRAALVKILSALYDAKLDLREIETLVAAEVGLSVRLFRLAEPRRRSRSVSRLARCARPCSGSASSRSRR